MSITEFYEKLMEANDKQTQEITHYIESSNRQITQRIENIETNLLELKKRTKALDRKLRRNNIVVFGLKVEKSDLLKNSLQKLNSLLNTFFTWSDINNIYLVGKDQDSRIVIEFLSFLKKQAIFSNIQKLKGTGVGIVNDLNIEDQKEQKSIKETSQASKTQNHNVIIRGNKLEINGSLYTLRL